MYRSHNIPTYDAFIQNNSILVIIALPRYISYQQVLTQRQFAVCCRITFCQNLSFCNTFTSFTDWTKVDGHSLVSTMPLRYFVFNHSWVKTHKLLIVSTIITDTDSCCINKLNHTITFSCYLCTRIASQLTFDTCTHNRRLIA